MKTVLTFDEWKLFEEVLMRMRAGYKVAFDDHNGTAEMLIDINTISVYRFDEGFGPMTDEPENKEGETI